MNKRFDKKALIWFMLLWAVLMTAAFYFCTLKQGFHEDEFYTYYSTARTNGFYVEDGKWMDRETIRNEFVVLPGEQFQYGLVKQVQSWDVHPPMYYWVFHTVASLVPGVFSKWIGLSVNLFFHGINLILLTYLSYLAGGRDVRMAYLATLFFGLTPAAMSGVVFIRMYEMLTTFILLCAVIHIQVVQRPKAETEWKEKLSYAKFLLLAAAVTYVGFLTQYYYFIFLFYMALSFGVYLLWRERNLSRFLWYGISQAAAFALACLTYPSCLGQMFRGQRGAQATENFFDLSNTFERIRFFLDLLNGYVFGYLFFVIFLAVVALAVRVYRRGGWTAERESAPDDARFGIAFWMLLFAVSGYFLTVAKTALLLGNTSNRYQLPVYGMIVFLVFYSCRTLWRQAAAMSGVRQPEGETAFLIRHRKYTERAALMFCLAMLAAGHLFAGVVFLYPEAREETALAREQAAAGIPVVYVYKPGEEWCVWAVADVLMEYDRVYFVSAGSGNGITEPAIVNAPALVVYLPLYDDAKDEAAQNMRIAAGCRVSERKRQFLYKYCESWYYSDGRTAADGGGEP